MTIATQKPKQDRVETATITTPTDRAIRIERVFHASRDRVWQAFTDPKLVAQWWGRGNKLVVERMELERGGTIGSSSIPTRACMGSRGAIAR